VVRVPLGDGLGVQQWGLSKLANDDLIVVGARKSAAQPDAGTAVWSEFAVFKLKGTNGERDLTFADPNADSGVAHDGVFSVGFGSVANPKTATVLANGGLFVSGYTNKAGVGNRPIVIKLTPAGLPDTTFANGGIYYPESGIDGFGTGGTAEAYDALVQGDKVITIGYGRESSSQPAVGWILIRLTPAGTVDNTFGTNGHTFVGINDQGANARSGVLLSDNRIVAAGGSSPPKPSADAGTQSQYATVGMFSANGAPDTAFGANGVRQYNLGGPATGRTNHHFHGTALSPDKKTIALVGVKGGITANSDAGIAGTEDQAVILLLPSGN
jgi:uncharacterized delta-60 repeat protein